MKNLFTLLIPAILFSLTFASCRTSLGTASFYTDNEWLIEGNGITQIWSDAVQTDRCRNKSRFNGGNFGRFLFRRGSWDIGPGSFHIDCRSNPGFPGDLFSWQAVYELGYVLCPYPWRVPTMQDFINLDIALGGTGLNRFTTSDIVPHSEFVINNYISRWGGAFGGYSDPGGRLICHQRRAWGNYWTLTEFNGGNGHRLGFNTDGVALPQGSRGKTLGLTLRCVR